MDKIHHNSAEYVPPPIEEARWRRPLCPYLMTGNHRILMHLDAFLIPQSFQWPAPGAPDRIGKRNLCDEWPYWRETAPEDAVIVFFAVEKDAAGSIAGVEFNFVVSYYFQQNYRVLPS